MWKQVGSCMHCRNMGALFICVAPQRPVLEEILRQRYQRYSIGCIRGFLAKTFGDVFDAAEVVVGGK